MIDAYTIGITLALDNGVSAGVATIRRDLQELDRAMRASALGLAQLRQAATAALGAGVATQAAAAQLPARRSPGFVVSAPAEADRENEPGPPAPPLPPASLVRPVIVTISTPAAVAEAQPSLAPAPSPALPLAAPQPAPAAPATAAPLAAIAAPSVRPTPATPATVAPAVVVLPPPAPPAQPLIPPPATVAPSTVRVPVWSPPIVHLPPPLPALVAAPPSMSPTPAPQQAVPAAAPQRPTAPRLAVDLAALGQTLLPPAVAEKADPIRLARQSLQGKPEVIAAARPRSEPLPPEPSSRRSPRFAEPVAVRHTAAFQPVRPRVASPPPGLPAQPGAAAPSLAATPSPAAGAAAPAAPAAQASGTRGTSNGDVFLDGARIGRWMSDQMGRSASRPPSGPTGFDPRQSPAWAGATVSP